MRHGRCLSGASELWRVSGLVCIDTSGASPGTRLGCSRNVLITAHLSKKTRVLPRPLSPAGFGRAGFLRFCVLNSLSLRPNWKPDHDCDTNAAH